MNQTITLIQALQITGICMGIVFLALIAIMMLISAFPYILSPKRNEDVKEAVSEINTTMSNGINEQIDINSEEEMVMAMVVCADATNGNDNMRVKVRSIRQIQ